jgi:hypothetical protein
VKFFTCAATVRIVRVLQPIVIVLTLVAIGCEGDEPIRTYQAPKDQPAAVGSPAAMAGQDAPAEQKRMWRVPEGWIEGPPAQMRVATYRTSDAPDVMFLVIRLCRALIWDSRPR